MPSPDFLLDPVFELQKYLQKMNMYRITIGGCHLAAVQLK